jgi:cytochrome c556
MADPIPDFTVEDLFPLPATTNGPVAPESDFISYSGDSVAPVSESSSGSAISAELLQMLERETDPRTVYPAEEGFFGKSDVFSYETEKEFTPEVREFVRRYYGPAEIQTDPEAGFVRRQWIRLFGDAPTEEEEKQIRKAQVLAERGSQFPEARYKRMMGEVYQGTPSAADIRGDIPEGVDIPPYLQKYAKKGRLVELPRYEAKVLLRDYGISQGSEVDQEIVDKSRDAANWLNQLESISPGLAQNTLGPILAADFNIHYGLTGTEREVTPESLNLRQITWEGDPRLVYTHPETENPTLLDPVKLELRDLAEVLPELMVIGGDIGGMVLGAGIGGTVGGLKGAVGGSILGGAFGAYYGRLKSLQISLSKNNFKFDKRFGGFVKKGYEDQAGNPIVITESDLYMKAIPDALFSLGGNVAIRALFKLGRLALFGTTGADAVKGGLTVEQFTSAVDHFKTTTLGQTARQAGGPWGTNAPTSVVLQKAGEDLIEQSRRVGVSTQDTKNMFQLGQQYLRQAEVLRAAEAGTPAVTARETIREQAIRDAEGEAAVTPEGVITARSEDVASAVEKGLPVTATREVTKQLDDILEQNRASLDEVDQILSRGTVSSADELGETLAAKSRSIMGDPTGTTGIYGVYNRIGTALSRRGRPGIPIKPFDVAPVKGLVDKIQQKSAAIGGAFPSEFLKQWNAMTARVGTKAGEKAGTFNLSYSQIKEQIISLRSELGGKLSPPQRDAMNKVLTELETIQIRGLQAIDEAGAAAGNPTSYAKQVQSANNQMHRIAEIWQRGFTKGLDTGSYHKISGKLFEPNASPDFVGNVMNTIRPGKDQIVLMRNTLLYRYKQAMSGLSRGELEVGVDLAGKRVRIGMGEDALTVRQANQAAHAKFMRENESWIKTLFKDGEFDKLGDEVTDISGQAMRLKKLVNFDKTLRENPIFGGRMVKITDDLSEVVIRAPERLMDEIYALAPGPRAEAFEELFKSLKGLPKLEREFARENIRGLLFRKLLRSEEFMAATRDEPFDAFAMSNAASAELKANSSIYDMVFGKSHRKNLEKIFSDINTLSRTGVDPAGAATFRRPLTQVPLAALKVYVGVLNRRARALTQGQKILGERLDRKFRAALLDPDKAARLVKGRNISTKSKLYLNALGQILGIEIGEALDATNTFGIDIDNYPGIPKSDLVTEALR